MIDDGRGDVTRRVVGGTARRGGRLAALPLGAAGRSLAGWGRRALGGDPEALGREALARNAEQVFAVLGELKGGAMKLGQTLAVFETMMPAEVAEPYREALTRLQTTAEPMPAATVHRVLAEQLGRGWRSRFAAFDDEPAGVASLGQVHRAVWSGGRGRDDREVAVKVQHPGADVALRSDLALLRRTSWVLARLMPGLDARALLDEIADRTAAELDYRREADHQRAHAAALAGDPEVCVPAVVASSPRVLVSEWLDGVPLSAWSIRPATTAAEQAERDRVAGALVELLFSSPARVGLLHADPHPGNVLVLRDGRVGLVDFGAVAELPDGVPAVLGRLMRMLADDDPGVTAAARAAGFLTGDTGDEDLGAWVGGMADPLRDETFHFTEAWMRRQGHRVVSPFGAAHRGTGRSLDLPARWMSLLRVTGGWMSVLARLDVTVPVRGCAEAWVAGFADPVIDSPAVPR
ncbi:MAG TPA: AarF/ABC1/UbiB kinase family protein [Actinomycetospora sp.]|uniref:ABC1 kinase family protein n=1 Tax=Actinomycetospora sp. TaxID=1872135 RepID=UPI002F3E6ABF